MSIKINIAVLCGGQSPEHEISMQSARNVVHALNSKKYRILLIYISKQGEWFLLNSIDVLEKMMKDSRNCVEQMQKIYVPFGENKKWMTLTPEPTYHDVDIVFPVLHGTHGEDGAMQGLLELANIAYVGSGVLGTAICMDKEVSKQLLTAAGILTAKWIVSSQQEAKKLHFDTVVSQLGLPFFVKPANAGSSVGISKIKSREQFWPAIDMALQYDHKILIEEYIAGQEIECAVMGSESPESSLPGEIVLHHEFYSYEAKYLDPDGAKLEIPAKLPAHITQQIQKIAQDVFKTLQCDGMARVDFFVKEDGRIYVNEANTIPGFTQISAYPKMWAASGLSYGNLLDKLIELAFKRFERNRVLIQKLDAHAFYQRSQAAVF